MAACYERRRLRAAPPSGQPGADEGLESSRAYSLIRASAAAGVRLATHFDADEAVCAYDQVPQCVERNARQSHHHTRVIPIVFFQVVSIRVIFDESVAVAEVHHHDQRVWFGRLVGCDVEVIPQRLAQARSSRKRARPVPAFRPEITLKVPVAESGRAVVAGPMLCS